MRPFFSFPKVLLKRSPAILDRIDRPYRLLRLRVLRGRPLDTRPNAPLKMPGITRKTGLPQFVLKHLASAGIRNTSRTLTHMCTDWPTTTTMSAASVVVYRGYSHSDREHRQRLPSCLPSEKLLVTYASASQLNGPSSMVHNENSTLLQHVC